MDSGSGHRTRQSLTPLFWLAVGGVAGAGLMRVVAGSSERGDAIDRVDGAPPSVPTVRLSDVRDAARRLAVEPRVASSREYAPGDPRHTDGREKHEGARLHRDVAAGCEDDQCRFSRCAKACTDWIRATYSAGELEVTRHRQQLYFNCTGYCFDPMELGVHDGGGDR